MGNAFFVKAINCLANHPHLPRSFFLSYLRFHFLFQKIIKSSSFEIFKKYVNVLLIVEQSEKFYNVRIFNERLNFDLEHKLFDHKITSYCGFGDLLQSKDTSS